MAIGQTLLKGNVRSITNDPLVGVSVSIIGTTIGIATDANGDFELLVPSGQDSIRFDYLGYMPLTLAMADGKMQVVLEEESKMLEAVQVAGFAGAVGQARRRAESVQQIPESVVTYTTEHIEATGITNFQSFANQVPMYPMPPLKTLVSILSISGVSGRYATGTHLWPFSSMV